MTISFVGGEKSAAAMAWLVENGIPAYGAPDLAVNAMAALREYCLHMRETANEPNRSNPTNQEVSMQITPLPVPMAATP